MDVNNTRFWQLLSETDWGIDQDPSPRARNLQWDSANAALRLKAKLFRFPTPPGSAAMGPEVRRGADADRFGNWYWIDETGGGLRYSGPATTEKEYWTGWSTPDCHEGMGDFSSVPATLVGPERLSGLCVTSTHYLVVGTLEPAGLLVFDLQTGGAPTRLLWPDAISFRPIDMSATGDGGLWILDVADGARLWLLDRELTLVPLAPLPELQPGSIADFEPLVAEVGMPAPPPWRGNFDRTLALELTIVHPVSVEALNEQEVLVLDSDPTSGYSRVERYRCNRAAGVESLARGLFEAYLEEGDEWEGAGLLAHDMALQRTPEGMRLFLVAADGNQAFEFVYQADINNFSLTLVPEYWPLSRFGGQALVSNGKKVFYDQTGRWVPLLPYHRPRYQEEGELMCRLLDSGVHDCRWHRLLLDAIIPPDTAVFIETRAHNDRELVEHSAWRSEPVPYLRHGGSEVPFHDPFPNRECDGAGTWETLLQDAQGRYLQLRLSLKGNGRATPRLRALRIYYPRFSYLESYLPAIYREDSGSAVFLERYLANIEGLFTSWEDRVAWAQVLFDVRSAPEEYLPWLADWLGLVLEADWESWRVRWFLSHAMDLFRQRGTVPGLLRSIRVATDPCHDDNLFQPEGLAPPQPVRLVEDYLLRRAPGVVFGNPTAVTAPGVTFSSGEWEPSLGAEPLHRRYREFLQQRYQTIEALNAAWSGVEHSDFEQLLLPPVLPCESQQAADWRDFLARGIGITYAEVTSDDRPLYQRLLQNRYRSMKAYAAYYGESDYQGFSAIPLPDSLPGGGIALQDWIHFVSVLLPTARHAHRFTLLVPAQWNDRDGGQGPLVRRARRVLEIERPAHTQYDIRAYWALFRVGEARLGLDSVIGEGARLSALTLGDGYLGQGYLTPPDPQSDRPMGPLACDSR